MTRNEHLLALSDAHKATVKDLYQRGWTLSYDGGELWYVKHTAKKWNWSNARKIEGKEVILSLGALIDDTLLFERQVAAERKAKERVCRDLREGLAR